MTWIMNSTELFASLNATLFTTAFIVAFFSFLLINPWYQFNNDYKRKGPLDEVQAAALVMAWGSRAIGPKVMHHGHPRREAVVGHK